MSEISPEISALFDRAGAGDAEAAGQLEAHYKALYPEPSSRAPAGAQAPPSPSAPNSPGSPAAAKAAISSAMSDADFMKKVNGGDEAALRRWEALHKAAYPGDDADQLDARAYTFAVPAWAEPDPEMQQQAATMFAAMGVPPREAAGLSDLWHEAASYGLDPATIELMGQETEQGLVAELGRAGAARLIEAGQQLVREAERHMPGLRALLAETGAGNHPGFVRRVGELALARQRGR